MRISRIYLPLAQDQIKQSITIAGDKAHYIRNVLRLKPKHSLHFFVPSGIEYQADIESIQKHEVVLNNIKTTDQQPLPSQLQSTLVQGISSSDRMDYSIQKAAELGCIKVVPVTTDFCSYKIPTNKHQKKQQHWQSVAISACEQSGRADVMQVAEITPLSQVVGKTNNGLFLDPKASSYISQLPSHLQTEHSLFIGPEGGFSPAELDVFLQHQFTGIQMGQRVLRTETMAPVVLSALHALYGDFKPPIR